MKLVALTPINIIKNEKKLPQDEYNSVISYIVFAVKNVAFVSH